MEIKRNEPKTVTISSLAGQTCYEAILSANHEFATRVRSTQPMAKDLVDRLSAEALELKEQSLAAKAEFFKGVAQNLAAQAGGREYVTVAIKVLSEDFDPEEKPGLQAALAATLTGAAEYTAYSSGWAKMRRNMVESLGTETAEKYEQSSLAGFTHQKFTNIAFTGIVMGLETEFEDWKKIIFATTQEPLKFTEIEADIRGRLEQSAKVKKPRAV